MNYEDSHNYIFNEIGEEGDKLLSLIAEDNIVQGINLIKTITSCTDETAKLIWVDLKMEFGTKNTNPFMLPSDLSPEKIAYANAVAREWQNKPKCPTCGSTNLKKISTTSKVANTVAFGIFGTKRHKTFHCNNCSYEW